MPRSIDFLHRVLLPTILSTACCIAVGLIFYQWQVFNPYNHRFVFVAWGITGALFFFALRTYGVRDSSAVLFVLWLLQGGLLTGAFHRGIGGLVVNLLFFSVIPAGVFVYFDQYYRRDRWSGWVGILTLGALAAAVMVIVRPVATLIIAPQVEQWNYDVLVGMLFEVSETFLIGAGLALGFFLSDLPAVRIFFRGIGGTALPE